MNTQRLMNTLLIAAVAAAATGSAASHASSTARMEACIDTFVKEYVPHDHPVRVVKRSQPRTMYMSFSSPETFEVRAKGAESGDSYGTATCIVDRKGQVLAMRAEGTPIRLAKRVKATEASGG